jgi:hypothetical protein
MKKIQFLCVGLCMLILYSCIKPNDSYNATLKNYTGLDGCGWVIKMNDGKVLEPTNLNDFISNPKENQKVKITYITENGMASICMVGKIVKITSLEK